MPRITPFKIALACGTAGAYVDVTTYASWAPGEGVAGSWGKQDQFRDTTPGAFSFYLDNYDGRFTPDTTNGILATPLTEGMGVSWQLGTRIIAGSILGFQMIDDNWGRIRVDVDDMLGSAARNSISVMVDAIVAGATPYLLWPLNDAAGTVTPSEAEHNGTGLLSLSGSSGSTFGSAAITGLNSATQLTLKDSLTPSASWPAFTFSYPTTTLGFYSFWITPQSGSKVVAAVSISGLVRSLQFGFLTDSYFVRDGDAGSSATYLLNDQAPHFVSMGLGTVFSAGNWTITATLYVDGVSRGSVVYGSSVAALDYRAPVGMSLTAVA